MSEHLQSGLHPDPDTLGAFAEGVLPEHERLACMAHLADCAACREVVYLAEEPLAVPAAVEVAWWRRWLRPIPVLSVGAVAGILVLSVGLWRMEKSVTRGPAAVVATAPAPPVLFKPPALKSAVEAPHVAARQMATRGAKPEAPAPVVVSRREDSLAAAPPLPLPLPASANDAFAINGSVSTPAGITGTVTDPAGAVIPGAAVSVRSMSGAPGVHATTDNLGQFQIAGLPPGQYELQVTSAGFQSATKKVEVQKDAVAQVDSSLSVGSVAETVQVTAASPLIATESATVARNKSGFAAIPLVGRMVAKKSAALPSKLAAVATASKDKVVLAADSAGALFRSDDGGKKWKAVKAVWQGKVVELTVQSAEFRLTTDTGAAWLSRDGNDWRAEK